MQDKGKNGRLQFASTNLVGKARSECLLGKSVSKRFAIFFKIIQSFAYIALSTLSAMGCYLHRTHNPAQRPHTLLLEVYW